MPKVFCMVMERIEYYKINYTFFENPEDNCSRMIPKDAHQKFSKYTGSHVITLRLEQSNGPAVLMVATHPARDKKGSP